MRIRQHRFCHTSLSPLRRGSLFYLGFWGAVGMFIPFLNLYFQQQLGFTGRQLGLLAIFFPLMTLVVATPLSNFADRRRWRIRILAILLFGFGLMLLLATWSQSFLVWLGMIFVLSLFWGPIVPLADSLIARMAMRHRLNYGSMRLWGSFSFATMAIGCGLLWQKLGFQAMFLITGLVFLPVALCALKLEEITVSSDQQAKPNLWDLRRDFGLVALIIISFLVGASIQFGMMFDGIYMVSLGGTPMLVGLMFGLSAFSELPTMQASAQIARRLSTPKTLLLGYGLLIAAFWGYTRVQQPSLLLLMTIIKGLGFGLFYVNTVRLTSERAPDHWASTVQAIVNASTFGLAPLIASPLGGEMYDRLGIRTIYIACSLLVAGAAVILSLSIFKGFFAEVSPDSGLLTEGTTAD